MDKSPVSEALKKIGTQDRDMLIEILDAVSHLEARGMALLAEEPRLVKKIVGERKLFELVVWPYRIPFTTRTGAIWLLHVFRKRRDKDAKELATAAGRARTIP